MATGARERRSSGCRTTPDRGRHKALAEVGCRVTHDAWPSTLSGGEAQRVALAERWSANRELLLLDEPFGALDASTRLKMHGLLKELCERHRPAVLLVTHDVDEAIALADRVLVLDEGRFRATARSTSTSPAIAPIPTS